MSTHSTLWSQSYNQFFQDQRYLEDLRTVDFNPIFILGPHRAGTTLLYETLASTGSFNCIKAYHVIKYQEILYNYYYDKELLEKQKLQEIFNSLGINDRGIDQVDVTPELPEEYGFILNNSGFNFYLDSNNIKLFKEICCKIQKTGNINQSILLKNPWCFSNFLYIKSIFPNAYFIFIHRHPFYIINSQLKTFRNILLKWNPYVALLSKSYRDLFKNYLKRKTYLALYSKFLNIGVRRLTNSLLNQMNYYIENVQSLPSSDYINLRYEDLCQSPQVTLSNILSALQQENSLLSVNVNKFTNPNTTELLPEIKANLVQLKTQFSTYLDYYYRGEKEL